MTSLSVHPPVYVSCFCLLVSPMTLSTMRGCMTLFLPFPWHCLQLLFHLSPFLFGRKVRSTHFHSWDRGVSLLVSPLPWESWALLLGRTHNQDGLPSQSDTWAVFLALPIISGLGETPSYQGRLWHSEQLWKGLPENSPRVLQELMPQEVTVGKQIRREQADKFLHFLTFN